MPWNLHLTSPLATADISHRLAGTINACEGDDPEGASVRVCSLRSGWTEEVFLDLNGEFFLTLDLTPESDQDYELTVCNRLGRVVACAPIRIRHRSDGLEPDQKGNAPLPDQRVAAYAPGVQPPWSVCIQRIRQCLHLAASVAQATGRDRDELLQYIHAQERYAEQAVKDNNRTLYGECLENLDQYAAYLEQIRDSAQPRPPEFPLLPADTDRREKIEQLRIDLAAVWKEVRVRRRSDLEEKLKYVAGRAQGLGQRGKTDSKLAMEEARSLLAEIYAVKEQLDAAGEPLGGETLPESFGVPGGQRLAEQ